MSKKKVAIVYGGKSVEHEISISSARNIFQYIDKSVFEVSIIGISKEGHWYFMNEVTSDFSNSEILDRKSTRLNSSHPSRSRMPSSA